MNRRDRSSSTELLSVDSSERLHSSRRSSSGSASLSQSSSSLTFHPDLPVSGGFDDSSMSSLSDHHHQSSSRLSNTGSGDSSPLDVIVSSLRRELRDCKMRQNPQKYSLDDGRDSLLNNSVGDIFEASYAEHQQQNSEPQQDKQQRSEYEHNLSISESADHLSKIRLRLANKNQTSAADDLTSTSKSNKMGVSNKETLCNDHHSIPSTIQTQTLSKTLQSALTICNEVLLDPVLDKIEANRTATENTQANPCHPPKPETGSPPPLPRHGGGRLRGVRSLESLHTPCQPVRRASKSWQRTRSGTLNPYTPTLHSRPTLEQDLLARASKHSVPSMMSDLSFDAGDDESSMTSFGSEVSSLGMGSTDVKLVLLDGPGQPHEQPRRRRRTSRKSSLCPSVDTALYGSGTTALVSREDSLPKRPTRQDSATSAALVSREDSRPKRPTRRRSQSPVARKNSCRAEKNHRFAATTTTSSSSKAASCDAPPCQYVRQISGRFTTTPRV